MFRPRVIHSIFHAPDVDAANRLLARAIEQWAKTHPKLAAWAKANIPDGFAVFALPAQHHVRCRTTNGLERINREIKRRTRVASIFPNTASCLRLVSALLAEQDGDWINANIYRNMTP